MRAIDRQILFVKRHGAMERLNGRLPLVNRIIISRIGPSLRIVKNRIVAVEEFQSRIIVVIVPLMGHETGGTVFFQDRVDVLSSVKNDAPLLKESEFRDHMAPRVRAQLDPIAVNHHHFSLPFRVSFGEGLCQQERVEITLLKGNVGIHDDDVCLMPPLPLRGGDPLHRVT